VCHTIHQIYTLGDMFDLPGQLTQRTRLTAHRHEAVVEECALNVVLCPELDPESDESSRYTARYTLGLPHVPGHLTRQTQATERTTQAYAHVTEAIGPVRSPASGSHCNFCRLWRHHCLCSLVRLLWYYRVGVVVPWLLGVSCLWRVVRHRVCM